MTKYGQTIYGPNGAVAVGGCDSRKDAVYKAVDMAINSNWKPPRWWQFWLHKWPADCVAEYDRRMPLPEPPQ